MDIFLRRQGFYVDRARKGLVCNNRRKIALYAGS